MPTFALVSLVDAAQELPPDQMLKGMRNKSNAKLRLTLKLELDQLWIGTPGMASSPFLPLHPQCRWLSERTEKVPISSIQGVLSEPIVGHEHYHILGLQLGTLALLHQSQAGTGRQGGGELQGRRRRPPSGSTGSPASTSPPSSAPSAEPPLLPPVMLGCYFGNCLLGQWDAGRFAPVFASADLPWPMRSHQMFYSICLAKTRLMH